MIRRVSAAAAILCALAGPAAASCLVVGDSIALGTGRWLGGCARDAAVGISSAAILTRVRRGFRIVVVSSGSNDALNPRLEANLEASRARAPASAWIWIAPQPRVAAAIVRVVAARHGDSVVTFRPGRDGIHPTSYPRLAGAVLARMRTLPVRLRPPGLLTR